MYQSLLFATDLLEGSNRLAKKAQQIADKFQAKLYLLHVVEPPISTQYAQALGFAEMINPPTGDASIVLDTLAETINIPSEQRIIQVGRASYQILEQAKELAVDGIIIASHASHNPLPQVLGSTAQKITQSASCDVITLKHPASE